MPFNGISFQCGGCRGHHLPRPPSSSNEVFGEEPGVSIVHQIRKLLFKTAKVVTPCGMEDSIKLLNLEFLPAIADRKFANCDAAIKAAVAAKR